MRSVPSYTWLLYLLIALSTKAQDLNCENYGNVNGSVCACPTGFGGDNCAQTGCGGTIFQGSQRPLTPLSSSGSGQFSNFTAAGCACTSDWTGVGCNICQSSNACQSAYTSASSSSSTTLPSDGQNRTMVCNTTPQVWASSQMSCQVDNPTLKAIFPLTSSLNIMRTLDPALSPIPNATSFGSSGTVYVQAFYEGVEQFYCYADSCSQTLSSDKSTNDWVCQNLRCTCRSKATFCGGSTGGADLSGNINGLSGQLELTCDVADTKKCSFQQDTLRQVFGANGLALKGCAFGECVRQNVIDNSNGTATKSEDDTGNSLSGGVIAGLAVVGGLVLLALILLVWGVVKQRKARKSGVEREMGGYGIEWTDVSYVIPKKGGDDKVILDEMTGSVHPGQMMAILGPSGAGKTTLIEILANKQKSGLVSGSVAYPGASSSPRIGFVPQQDILPPLLTVHEALMFAANLKLPESITPEEKVERVERLMEKLGILKIRDTRIGGEKGRGVSGGEMRRVSIGVELIAAPEVLLLDEPTSGLDSVSAANVAKVLHAIAHDPENPTAVVASIHQPSSQLYQTFDTILLLSHGRVLYSGEGGFSPVEHFNGMNQSTTARVPIYQQGYNVADYLLEVASDPSVGLFDIGHGRNTQSTTPPNTNHPASSEKEGARLTNLEETEDGSERTLHKKERRDTRNTRWRANTNSGRVHCPATFLTQLQALSGREWKLLKRDKTLFITHVGVAAVLGVFCGGLYYQTGLSIAGFQSRVGCLFFLGALIAFSSLSALYNVVESRPLFLRERSSGYYSPTAWLLARFLFDVIPLRIVPTIIVSTITYWMAGLAGDAAHYFKFLFILVLYTLAMTLFNFLLGALFRNGGVAILLSALSALYQMTFAGFFVHLQAIPPVLRWLQWLCPLKYTLEALSVNEVSSGLQIVDTLEGVPVNVSASLIMNLLFGFGQNNYYRDVLVLFAFIAGFGVGVIGVVWLKVRERR